MVHVYAVWPCGWSPVPVIGRPALSRFGRTTGIRIYQCNDVHFPPSDFSVVQVYRNPIVFSSRFETRPEKSTPAQELVITRSCMFQKFGLLKFNALITTLVLNRFPRQGSSVAPQGVVGEYVTPGTISTEDRHILLDFWPVFATYESVAENSRKMRPPASHKVRIIPLFPPDLPDDR